MMSPVYRSVNAGHTIFSKARRVDPVRRAQLIILGLVAFLPHSVNALLPSHIFRSPQHSEGQVEFTRQAVHAKRKVGESSSRFTCRHSTRVSVN